MRILIVEDSQPIQILLERIVKPLMAEFPGSTIIISNTLAGALVHLSEMPYPDIALLDLTLDDATIEQTIASIPRMQETCPVAIVTGHSKEKVKELLGDIEVPIIEKDPQIWRRGDWMSNPVIQAIVNLMRGRKDRDDFATIWDNLKRMEEIANDGKRREGT